MILPASLGSPCRDVSLYNQIICQIHQRHGTQLRFLHTFKLMQQIVHSCLSGALVNNVALWGWRWRKTCSSQGYLSSSLNYIIVQNKSASPPVVMVMHGCIISWNRLYLLSLHIISDTSFLIDHLSTMSVANVSFSVCSVLAWNAWSSRLPQFIKGIIHFWHCLATSFALCLCTKGHRVR